MVSKFDVFFDRHPIFSFEDIYSFFSKNEGTRQKSSTLYNQLTYYQLRGRIARIRRGLYLSVPKGVDPSQCPIDPFLIASKMAEDVIIGYRTALDFFGKLHTVCNEFIYISKKVKPLFVFKNVQYKAVSVPPALKKSHNEQFGVLTIDKLGQKIRVTSLERTLVDILDKPNLCGSWEEIWRSLESIEYFDMDQVVKYALLLDVRTTIAKLGFFLDNHRDRLMIPDSYIEALLKLRPKNPFYLDRDTTQSQKLITKWNLIVPISLLNREWEEPHENI